MPPHPDAAAKDQNCVIALFRYDLRLNDHPALTAAFNSGRPVLPVYILDEASQTRPMGAAQKWWLHQSLTALDGDLRRRGAQLIVRKGDTYRCLKDIVDACNVKAVYGGAVFDPATMAHDSALKGQLSALGVEFRLFNATRIVAPGKVLTKAGTPFRVFTPFYKALRDMELLSPSHSEKPAPLKWPAPRHWPECAGVDALSLKPEPTASGIDWKLGFQDHTPGETRATKGLETFLEQRLYRYAEGRDRPDMAVTSGLSAHLRFGEISPVQILRATRAAVEADTTLRPQADKFISEVVWREFSYELLHLQPRLHDIEINARFAAFPWQYDVEGLRAWQRGETGYELVDAGMKELWRTGFMHNRVRMIVASFLTKHLLIDWREGEKWFWDCLLDADPASNPASWQWVAGCGADAAPYFRIFNPITAAEKFDPNRSYRTTYLDNAIASNPEPIIGHAFARERALSAYASLKDTRLDEHSDPG